jgi:NADPH:quinone reductase-like Zn-dependent oxidoreductase
MRVAIVGSRDFTALNMVVEYVNSLPNDTVVISGGAIGVDRAAEQAAKARGLKVVIYFADWNLHGKAAGQIRNKTIVNDCDTMVAFWDGVSTGTKGSIHLASKAGKLEKVFRDKNPNQGSLF